MTRQLRRSTAAIMCPTRSSIAALSSGVSVRLQAGWANAHASPSAYGGAGHGQGKLISPGPVLANRLDGDVTGLLREGLTRRILREADLEGRVATAKGKLTP